MGAISNQIKCSSSAVKGLILSLSLLPASASAAFIPLTDFGANPGSLTASYLEPKEANKNLVVLLHGCEQNGETLAEQSGLASLAKSHQFSLLIPQQSYDNNIKKCFNWFSPQDTNLDSGEMLSIKNMILAAKKELDTSHVYLLGLSAGGAMSSAILVNYPELVDAGAIIAGLPFPCANNLTTAISCMRKGPLQPASELVSQVRKVQPIQQSWPRLTVWTGDSDSVVNPINAEKLAYQWAGLKQQQDQPTSSQAKGVHTTQWRDSNNEVAVELVTITGLEHGIAVNPAVSHGGTSAPFLLTAPISSAIEIVRFWNI
ncbi:LpqC, poly [Shewanella sairae]|uniref:LpqC, poly n=1 Tax=Shewanella sairae TaxID=190310 RepID=A0ABQ4PF70_9GAMM|nr:PHB depolymerase family esterase [Shewanella sairae]MCL1131156.1 PHB depolymerase family esterase [Shewanella sairae]GIU46193.1 LpqC, poly [Shewanella sairae]